jgi:transcriptional regulator with XRE-family HTH domain
MENDARYGPLTRQVAENAHKIRTQRRLTLADVADRMTALGRPLTLNGVSKIERGNRGVDLDDVVALARALDVPPVVLILPLGAEPTVEVFPGASASTWDAARWFTGEQQFPSDVPGQQWADRRRWEQSPVALFRTHDRLVQAFLRVDSTAGSRSGADKVWLSMRDDALDQLMYHRERMRQLGVEPGDVPAGVPLFTGQDGDVVVVGDEEGDRGQR